MGKRKRSDECPRLSALASADVPAEVSCIHAIETQEGATAHRDAHCKQLVQLLIYEHAPAYLMPIALKLTGFRDSGRPQCLLP